MLVPPIRTQLTVVHSWQSHKAGNRTRLTALLGSSGSPMPPLAHRHSARAPTRSLSAFPLRALQICMPLNGQSPVYPPIAGRTAPCRCTQTAYACHVRNCLFIHHGMRAQYPIFQCSKNALKQFCLNPTIFPDIYNQALPIPPYRNCILSAPICMPDSREEVTHRLISESRRA